jgi:hypothetical protein
MRDYGRALWHSIGGKWVLLPGLVSGLIGIYGFLQHNLRCLPTMSWWAVIPLAFAPITFWVIGGLTRQVVLLERRLKPKIKCSFSSAHADCIRPNTVVSFLNRKIVCTYYRIKVEADCSGHVSDCRGHLLFIKHGNKIIFQGENIILPFAHSDKNDAVVYEGVPEYLDFLVITDDNEISSATRGFKVPSSINYQELFSQPGDYEFDVVISSPKGPSVSIKPVLKWSGDRLTSKMTNVAGQIFQP